MKLFLIVIFSFFFRFIYLGYVPVSLSHDETDNIIQAHAFITTGSDIEGNWKLSKFLPNSGTMAELAPLINTPALSIFPNTLSTARLTSALLSSLFPLILFFWLMQIGVKRSVSYLTAALITISPWHILFSRTALEQPTSLFFYLLSWLILAKYTKTKLPNLSSWMFLALFYASYTLGFFTYHGYKFALPVLTTILIIWHYVTSPTKPKILKFSLPFIIVIALFLRTLYYSSNYSTRSSELIFTDLGRFDSAVNNDRRQSLAPDFLKKIYTNKMVKLTQTIRDKYIATINPDLLYLHGEANGVFSTWQSGYLYLIFLPLLIIGLGYLILTHNQHHILIILLLLASPLASVLHVNNSLAFRSGIYFVILNIIIAYGLDIVYHELGKIIPRYRNLLRVVFAIMVTISLTSFLYIYFFVTPVTNSNAYFFSDRLVANYINRASDKKILLIVSQPRYLYSSIKLFKTNVSISDIESFNHQYSPTNLDEYFTPNLTIVHGCPKDNFEKFDTIIIANLLIEDLKQCKLYSHFLEDNSKINESYFVSPKDSGAEYRIIGDQLCSGQELSSYIHPTSLKDFKLETMSVADFCVKWVVKQ